MNGASAQRKSLSEVHASVDATSHRGWRKLLAFLGPAYLVSVGYMDPGNPGHRHCRRKQGLGTRSSECCSCPVTSWPSFSQSLSARLGVVRQLDLAQASRTTYHPSSSIFACGYWPWGCHCCPCDLAEVLGMAIGLKLLFGLSLIWGVSLTVLDTLLLLILQSYGLRKIEAFIIALVVIIGIFIFNGNDLGQAGCG